MKTIILLCLLIPYSLGAVGAEDKTGSAELQSAVYSPRIERELALPLYPGETVLSESELNSSPREEQILIQIFYPELLLEEICMVA
jgi:hypothetical protein